MRLLLAFFLFFATVVEARELSDLRTYGEPAPSSIYIFASPDCPNCREFYKGVFPDILKRFVYTKKAQVFIVDMVARDAALKAAMVMRCLPDDKAHKMAGWVYESQDRWVRAANPKPYFLQYAKALGMTSKEFNECLANEQLKSDIEDQREQLRLLYQVRGTPTTVLRQGNIVKHYVGKDRKAILHGLEQDIEDYEKQQAINVKAK